MREKEEEEEKQARKPCSYASLKQRPSDQPTHLLTRVKSRATSVVKNKEIEFEINIFSISKKSLG